jgi:HSP20 family protein
MRAGETGKVSGAVTLLESWSDEEGAMGMSLSRYHPFDGFPLSLRDPSAWATDLFGLRPSFPVDVYEDESSYFVEASLPGMKPAEISVSATSDTITIHAATEYDDKQEKKAEDKEKKTGAYVRRERYNGEVTRIIELPSAFTPDKIKATYKHGVLSLEIPKTGEGKPTPVEVKVE